MTTPADIGAVLISRLRHETTQPKRGKRRSEARLIAGLIPVADGPISEEMATALWERQNLIEVRALALAESAVERGEPWLMRLGEPPVKPGTRQRYLREVRTVSAYRDRYRIDTRAALGDDPRTDAQKLDAARAEQAIRRAWAAAEEVAGRAQRSRAVGAGGPSIR